MGWRGLVLAVLIVLGGGALLLAQAGPSEEAHRLARTFLVGARAGTSFDAVAAAKRGKIIASLKPFNGNGAQVDEAVDRIVTPALYAKLPKLLVQCEDALVRHLTKGELRSLVRDEGDDDVDDMNRRNAAAKLWQVQADIEQAAAIWGRDSCREIFAENRVALASLGLDKAVAAC